MLRVVDARGDSGPGAIEGNAQRLHQHPDFRSAERAQCLEIGGVEIADRAGRPRNLPLRSNRAKVNAWLRPAITSDDG
jgi:hypothetical protein